MASTITRFEHHREHLVAFEKSARNACQCHKLATRSYGGNSDRVGKHSIKLYKKPI